MTGHIQTLCILASKWHIKHGDNRLENSHQSLAPDEETFRGRACRPPLWGSSVSGNLECRKFQQPGWKSDTIWGLSLARTSRCSQNATNRLLFPTIKYFQSSLLKIKSMEVASLLLRRMVLSKDSFYSLPTNCSILFFTLPTATLRIFDTS
jgi:hypothetical protein